MILDTPVIGSITVLDILKIVLIFLIATVIAKVLSSYIRLFFKDRLSKQPLSLLIKGVKYTIYIIAIMMVLPILGVNPSGILVAGGILGIVIGFASQSVVSNLISGIFLISEKPIQIGDVVEVGGTTGEVTDIRILSTTIKTFDGTLVRVPNNTVFNSPITNYIYHKVRRFGYVVGIRYRDDGEKAVEVIKEVLDEHPLVLKSPEPLIFVDELADNSVNIVIKVWAPVEVWYSVKMELLWKIKVALEEAGVEIPFPQTEVWFNTPLRIEKGSAGGEI
ncbi:MAG: mechanosensitive ion channel family protein [Thermoplasmata archaeon]|nr:mechanosensitive ion channel family protein [Thermoplasmata archaeon]OYT47231.1 MAG: mechanosensitive ion channel protein MscS [Thermoplasmatales archaeon ex4484_36]HDD59689.1 mechanosensitive ion channel family protein [Euryarchaeota archaeon]RLF55170.1 MAG: mechanosensitive ion channel family protein [Thermoplasmata archaeon]RLF69803.1 MAG: mechanosensitive ion channel family protein [Thermoplasmata archaeon]